MNLKRGLWVWVAIVSALAIAGWRVQYFDLQMGFICSKELVERDEPAADLLFIGSSRLGTNTDIIYIQENLRERTGNHTLRVEKMIPLGPNPMQLHVMLRDMAKIRGLPKVIVMATPHNLGGGNPYTGMPLWREGTILTASLSSILAAEREFLRNDPMPYFRRVADARWQSFPELLLQRTKASVFSMLRAGPRAYDGSDLMCPIERRETIGVVKLWAHGTVDDDSDLTKHPTYASVTNDKRYQKQLRKANVFRPVDPTQPERVFEIEVMREIANFVSENGSQLVLTSMPIMLQTAMHPGAVDAYMAAIPNAVFLDAYGAIEELSIEDHEVIFRNFNHMNLLGARYMSQFWVRELEGYFE